MAALAPPGTCRRIAPSSGLAFIGVGVADVAVHPDSRGETKVIMSNAGPQTHWSSRAVALPSLPRHRQRCQDRCGPQPSLTIQQI
eukprot:6901425-Pyramimonas_sp.AAC.1